MTGEDRRKLVHVAMAGWIVALPWLGETWALVLAGAAIVVNWVVLPRTALGRGLHRSGEGFFDGVKLYPVAVLAALLLFPLPVAAAAWAVLGVGDAASNVVGRRWGRPPFLGRSDRSPAGTVAFVVTAAPAAWLAEAWVDRAWSIDPLALAAALAAAAAGAAAELLTPRPLDDNLSIALAAGAAFLAVAP